MRRLRSQHRFFLALTAAIAISACGKRPDNLANFSSTDPGTGAQPPPVTTTDAPLALQVYTKYDDTDYQVYWTFDETGSTQCTSSITNASTTCTVRVPEGRLYFSSLNIAYSWNNQACKLLRFIPYQYEASDTGGFRPPWSEEEIDCALDPQPATCWGGAALDMVPSFPQYRSLIHLPDEALGLGNQSLLKTARSGFARNTSTNRTVVNDIASANVGSAIADFGTVVYAGAVGSATNPILKGSGDAYIANTYSDYVFECLDHYYDPIPPTGSPFKLTLFVKDVSSDSGNPTLNNFGTWIELP